jgi:hypothetical protein
MSKTSGTWWVIPTDGGKLAIQMFRGTFLKEGHLEMAGGSHPHFDPATAKYATSDMVTNICAAHNITIHGDTASARRFMHETHAWKQVMDLDQAIAHSYLGKTMPSRDVIVAAYASDEVVEG